MELTVPQPAPAQPFPEAIQVTVRLGLPAEFTVAVKGREDPSSSAIDCGETVTEMSLVIVTCAVATLVLSATLVAWTMTEPDAGRSPGEVYTPLGLIIPSVALPPWIPFTL